MGILDWLPGRRRTAGPSVTRGQAAEDAALDPDRVGGPLGQELSHGFVCSPNQSLIEAYHGLFRNQAPTYGGSAAVYLADKSVLNARQTDAGALAMPFAGQQFLGLTVNEMDTVAQVLEALSLATSRGRLYVSYVTVGAAGQEWVRLVYVRLLGEAKRQGIAPFCMYTTARKDAAQFLLDSFSLVPGA